MQCPTARCPDACSSTATGEVHGGWHPRGWASRLWTVQRAARESRGRLVQDACLCPVVPIRFRSSHLAVICRGTSAPTADEGLSLSGGALSLCSSWDNLSSPVELGGTAR